MITPEHLLTAWREAASACQHFQLPFGRQAWLGQQGNWLGSGLGSSIDFQDHRAYMPGDDPRYIHWAAYARTGQLTMKLYRAEVAPLVDVMVDVSASMMESPAKAERSCQLLAFCVASADAAASPVRVHAANARQLRDIPAELVRANRWADLLPTGPAACSAPGPLPWRPAALKVLISDLLFPDSPESVLMPMTAGSGLCIVLRPGLPEESDFAHRGNIELIDVESGEKRRQRIDEGVARRYRESYARHFDLWDLAARRRGVIYAPVDCDSGLKDALSRAPLSRGAITVHD